MLWLNLKMTAEEAAAITPDLMQLLERHKKPGSQKVHNEQIMTRVSNRSKIVIKDVKPLKIISELGVLFCAEGDITTTSTSRPFQDAIKRSGYQNWTSMVVENTLALDYYVPQNIVPQKFNGIKKIGDREGTYKSTNLCLCQQHLCAIRAIH